MMSESFIQKPMPLTPNSRNKSPNYRSMFSAALKREEIGTGLYSEIGRHLHVDTPGKIESHDSIIVTEPYGNFIEGSSALNISDYLFKESTDSYMNFRTPLRNENGQRHYKSRQISQDSQIKENLPDFKYSDRLYDKPSHRVQTLDTKIRELQGGVQRHIRKDNENDKVLQLEQQYQDMLTKYNNQQTRHDEEVSNLKTQLQTYQQKYEGLRKQGKVGFERGLSARGKGSSTKTRAKGIGNDEAMKAIRALNQRVDAIEEYNSELRSIIRQRMGIINQQY